MNRTVLVVEDDVRNQRLFRDFLEKFDFIVLEAGNGQDAVERAKQYRPDIILMDIQMPLMNGMDATRLIKADPETAKIPVVALTSYAMKDDEIKIRACGCDDYMTKPVDLRKLLQKINEFTGKKEGMPAK